MVLRPGAGGACRSPDGVVVATHISLIIRYALVVSVFIRSEVKISRFECAYVRQ